jgi:DNA-directed RNA polymerase specialized sigma24 family protein
MARFNPDFWEVTLDSRTWDRIPAENGLWHEEPEEGARRLRLSERTRGLWPLLRPLLDEVLTERQRQVVVLHFLEELNQRQVAERLGLTQQAVSEHLYGKVRDGRRVGGAMRKLRKACELRGIRWG